jgi:hypothetical protein
MDRGESEEDGSIRFPVDELRRLSETYGSATIFEPQSDIGKRDSSTGNSVSPTLPAPEKKLTLFALRLAIFEKAATCL